MHTRLAFCQAFVFVRLAIRVVIVDKASTVDSLRGLRRMIHQIVCMRPVDNAIVSSMLYSRTKITEMVET